LQRKVKEKTKELYCLGYKDQLTGLFNRRFFEEELARIDVPENLPLTIVMADVNGLKLVNDSFGHSAGDDLLKKVAKVILKGCRSEDMSLDLVEMNLLSCYAKQIYIKFRK
jgi:diguanylate cyclase (GGDEF)-like protein